MTLKKSFNVNPVLSHFRMLPSTTVQSSSIIAQTVWSRTTRVLNFTVLLSCPTKNVNPTICKVLKPENRMELVAAMFVIKAIFRFHLFYVRHPLISVLI